MELILGFAVIAVLFIVCGVIFIAIFEELSGRAERKRKRLKHERDEKHQVYLSEVIADPKRGIKRPRDHSSRREYILNRDNYRCTECGDNTCLHVHHIVPVSIQPDHSEQNLVTLCIRRHPQFE